MAITEWEIRRGGGGDPVRVLLCDDDPAFLELLSGELRRIFTKLGRNVELRRFSGPGALAQAAPGAWDLAFLDIDFEDEEQNGIDAARGLRQGNSRGLIFFVTNFIEYAPTGYEVQAFRYILKRDIRQLLERYILQAMEQLAEGASLLRLRDREQVTELPLERIAWLEVLDHYVTIHAGEEAYTMGATLSALERELQQHGFLRIHKSYLVNMAFIRKFRSRECLLSDGTVLAVSEKNYAAQKQNYLLWKGLR